jgi:hypothetical protein
MKQLCGTGGGIETQYKTLAAVRTQSCIGRTSVVHRQNGAAKQDGEHVQLRIIRGFDVVCWNLDKVHFHTGPLSAYM